MRTITHAIGTRPYFRPSVQLEKIRPGTEARLLLAMQVNVGYKYALINYAFFSPINYLILEKINVPHNDFSPKINVT